MKIYNTLSGKKEEFVPISPEKVSFYVCGPTVYNFIHIGNARPLVVFDAARRYMEYKGFRVTYITNFTDVDDKIIRKANEEGISPRDVAETYIREFIRDGEGLNVLPASYNPRVTEEMPEIINMVKTLMDKGHAYERNGSVFFDVSSSRSYGKLSKRSLDDMEAGARVDINEDKDDPMDFLLWKSAKPGEPSWDSPWGKGRPGWHIECSAMAKKYLGDNIDIHAGGEDLIFPHHENEIAQSEAVNGKPFAKYWLHNSMINIENKKMSKSKGNFFTLREVAEQFPYETIRFFLLSVHYRNPINFSGEIMQAAQNGLDRIINCKRRLEESISLGKNKGVSPAEAQALKEADQYVDMYCAAMEDDLNTANGITALFELVKFINTNGKADSSMEFLQGLWDKLELLLGLLGVKLDLRKTSPTEDGAVEELIAKRQKARQEKNWGEADIIRDRLKAMGIVIQDSPDGVKWHRES